MSSLKCIRGKTAVVPEMPILNDLHRAGSKQCSVGRLCHANAIMSWGRANTGRFVVGSRGALTAMSTRWERCAAQWATANMLAMLSKFVLGLQGKEGGTREGG